MCMLNSFSLILLFLTINNKLYIALIYDVSFENRLCIAHIGQWLDILAVQQHVFVESQTNSTPTIRYCFHDNAQILCS